MEFLIESTMRLILDKLQLWVKVKMCDLFRYGIGQARSATLDDIEVVHSSQNYLVLNKRYDVLINSDDRNIKVTLEHQIRKLIPTLADPKLVHGFYFVHRLDYATSGVICIAKNKKAAACASAAFSKRKTLKYYIALLRGHISQENETIDLEWAIGLDSRPESNGRLMCIGSNPYCEKPRWAHTRLLILEIGYFNNEPVTKVMLKLITGRRHQLRVHCDALGHTIVGDFTYSNRKDVLPYRMFLHSHRMILPTSMENLDVSSGDVFQPSDLKNWVPIQTLNTIDENSYNKLDGI